MAGIVPDFTLPSGLDLLKRHNVIYAMSLFCVFYSNEILGCIVIEENGTAEQF